MNSGIKIPIITYTHYNNIVQCMGISISQDYINGSGLFLIMAYYQILFSKTEELEASLNGNTVTMKKYKFFAHNNKQKTDNNP